MLLTFDVRKNVIEKLYVIYLDKTKKTKLYVRYETENRRLLVFSLVLTTIKVEEEEVVRFDSCHGKVHVHKFYGKEETIQDLFYDISFQTMNLLKKEIIDNYKKLVKRYAFSKK